MSRLIVLAEDGTQIEISQDDEGMCSWHRPVPCSASELWLVRLEDAINSAQVHADNKHRKDS